MESLISRYRNVTILVAVLFAQVVGLAMQVRHTSEHESSRLIRVWAVGAVTPLEKAIVWIQNSVSGTWHNYLYLRGVRQENRGLKEEIQQLRLQQVRLTEDAEQARRLQALLGFKEQYISKTMAAQVIGSSGSQQSRSIYIDKGANDGIQPDMPVITARGVVGKVLNVYGSTSQVLLINDQSSGVGAILEKSRLQGVLKGTPAGEIVLEKVMSDEDVQLGQAVLTSGGDRIFPKGLPAGTVTKASRSPESFLTIRIKPAVDLAKLEEVLVITKKEDKAPNVNMEGLRAADILAQRLPSVPEKPAEEPGKSGVKTSPPPQPEASESKPQSPRIENLNSAGTSSPGRAEAPAAENPIPKPAIAPQRKPPVVKVSAPPNSGAARTRPQPETTQPAPPQRQDNPQ